MTADPPGGKDDLESRKTRFVPRGEAAESDAAKPGPVSRLAPGAPGAAPSDEAGGAPTPGGTVIGRTRLVGFGGQAQAAPETPAAATPAPAAAATMKMGAAPVSAKTEYIRADSAPIEPVVAWVVVVKGPGRGGYKPVFVGMNSLGRDASQRICLDYGDDTISREDHAFITYDDEQRRFYVQHGGKSNIVRLGSEPLLTPAELKTGDLIRIGKTTLRFYPCCGPDFSWTDEVPDA